MPETLDRLKEQAVQLPARERAELADFLWESLADDPDADAAFEAELLRRLENYQAGRTKAKPAAQLLAELREKFP